MSQNIYTYDSVNDQLNPISGGGGGEGGHVIKDESGTSMTQRSVLQFDGLDVTDDSTNSATKVTARETNFVGTTAEWNALSAAEKIKYKTVDLTDDFNGDPIDSTPTANSPHAVSSGGVKAYVDEKVDSSSNFVGTLAEWEALTSEEKAQYKTVDITEEISPDLGIALQQTVTLSASTDTTVTFTDPRITALSEIQVYAGRSTGDVQGSKNRFPCSDVFTSVSNGTGSCAITFPKEESEVSVIVRIYVR